MHLLFMAANHIEDWVWSTHRHPTMASLDRFGSFPFRGQFHLRTKLEVRNFVHAESVSEERRLVFAHPQTDLHRALVQDVAAGILMYPL